MKDQDSFAFDEVLDVLQRHPDLNRLEFDSEPVLSLPNIEIYPSHRRVYKDQKEIPLTTTEFNLLCLLVANKGRVQTYPQIYENVWGDTYNENEREAIS